MARLVYNPGGADERVWTVNGGIVRIGRMVGSEVEIPNRSLSREHARIDHQGAEVVLTDLQSTNGTSVNDQRISQRLLRDRDVIKCGDILLTWLADGEPVPSLATPWARNSLSHDSVEKLFRMRTSTEDSALNLDTFDPAERDKAKLKMLLRVSELLSSPEDVERLLARIVGLLFEILDVDRAVILTVNAASGELEPRVQKSKLRLISNERIYSQTIVNYVREHGAAALFTDAKGDIRVRDGDSIVAQSIDASMAAPMRTRERVIGVIYVDNLSTPARFTEEDLEFLGAFANQSAIALDNAELYRRIESEAILRHNLLRFFPPAAAAQISRITDLNVVETEVTALFCDISNFTGLSARFPPRVVVELLNVYFPAMADIVFRHEGMLEKYIGDALLAVWGAPTAQPGDADRALAAALDMQRAMGEVNRRLLDRGLGIQVHIGLNTGTVAAGNIGSDRFLQYATIGDATNMASRVSGIAGPDQIVITEATRLRLSRDRHTLRPLGPTQVKGKDEPLELWLVDG